MKTIHEKNYDHLIKLVPDLWLLPRYQAMVSRLNGGRDLHLNLLLKEQHQLIVSLSHYYEVDNHWIPDPDVVIKVSHHKTEKGGDLFVAEVLRYQDSLASMHNLRYFRRGKAHWGPFLERWLSNCLSLGYVFSLYEGLLCSKAMQG